MPGFFSVLNLWIVEGSNYVVIVSEYTVGFHRALNTASGAWLDLGSGQGAHRPT